MKRIILMGHGSRSSETKQELERIVDRLKSKYHYSHVDICFFSIGSPTLPEILQKCAAENATEVIVIPFFLLMGMHIRVDIPKLIKEESHKYPSMTITCGHHMGFDELIVDLINKRIQDINLTRFRHLYSASPLI